MEKSIVFSGRKSGKNAWFYQILLKLSFVGLSSSQISQEMLSFLLVLSFCIILTVAQKKDAGPVTCGSVIKLVHKETVCFQSIISLKHAYIFIGK